MVFGARSQGWSKVPDISEKFPFERLQRYYSVIPAFVGLTYAKRKLAFVVVDIRKALEDDYYLVFLESPPPFHIRYIRERLAWVNPKTDIQRFTMVYVDTEKSIYRHIRFEGSNSDKSKAVHVVDSSGMIKTKNDHRLTLFIGDDTSLSESDSQHLHSTEKFEFPTLYYGDADPTLFMTNQRGSLKRKVLSMCCCSSI
jgi:hypothetical protein